MILRRRQDRTGRLRIGSMALLLCLLVLDVFVVPFALAPDSLSVRIARDVLLSLILLSGIAAVSDHRTEYIVVALVAGVTILIRCTSWLVPLDTIPGLRRVGGGLPTRQQPRAQSLCRHCVWERSIRSRDLDLLQLCDVDDCRVWGHHAARSYREISGDSRGPNRAALSGHRARTSRFPARCR